MDNTSTFVATPHPHFQMTAPILQFGHRGPTRAVIMCVCGGGSSNTPFHAEPMYEVNQKKPFNDTV